MTTRMNEEKAIEILKKVREYYSLKRPGYDDVITWLEMSCPICSGKYTLDKVIEYALPRIDNKLCNAHLHEVFRKIGGHDKK